LQNIRACMTFFYILLITKAE